MTKIYFAHIPKSGGTTINAWLDDAVSYEKAMPGDFRGGLTKWFAQSGIGRQRGEKAVSNICWEIFDVIHGHDNNLAERTQDTVVVTIFRQPVERCISLFYDQASLSEAHLKNESRRARIYYRDCRSESFSTIRAKWSKFRAFQEIYADQVCRHFLSSTTSFREFCALSPRARFERAVEKIEQDVNGVGFTESMEKTAGLFSKTLGLYPVSSLPRLNLGRPKTTPITDEDRQYLASINVADQLLYDYFRKRFDDAKVDYSAEDFERDRLPDAIKRVAVRSFEGHLLYDMNAALLGSGFWGRDGAGQKDCCRWTGPENDSTLYIPACRDGENIVDLLVRGWMSGENRASLEIKVWGEPVAHKFLPAPKLADIVRFRASPRNGILKLQFHCRALTDDECLRALSDGRRKGFAISHIKVTSASAT